MILGEQTNVEHLATGGTMDSEWIPEQDTARSGSVSQAAEYLRFLSDIGYPVIPSEVLTLKDSRELTVADKKMIARRTAESAVQKAEVTSGTYMMVELGRRIASHPGMRKNPFDKHVAMVASIIPLTGFSMPDAGFNLGMSHAALEDLNGRDVSAVVGVINGTVAPIDALEKDLTTATFESVDPSVSLLSYSRYTLIPAGGTIDFHFNGLDGVEPAGTSFVPGYLRNHVRSMIDFDAMPPILKDSRNLTDEDMERIVELVRQAPTEHILVTSGLIRIAELRERLNQALRNGDDHDRGRRVILTGSRFMLDQIGWTDAPYNLGYGHGKLGSVEPGAHITVAGRLIDNGADPMDYVYTQQERELIERESERRRNE